MDPTGRFWNIVVGAVAGAVIGGVVAAIMSGGDLNAIGVGMATGAIGGAITGATFGLAAAAIAPGMTATTLVTAGGILATGGAVSSVASDLVGNAIQGKENDWGTIAGNAAMGAVTNILFAGSGGLASKGLLGPTINPGKWKDALTKLKPITKADEARGKLPMFDKMPMLKYSGDNPAITKTVSMLNNDAFHQPLTASGIMWGLGRGAARTTMFKTFQTLTYG